MNTKVTLENDQLIVEVKRKGAELSRIYSKTFNREILWNADKQYWARHAPVLFPIVGKVKNNEYEVKGEKYSLGQHGFARDSDFELKTKNDNRCKFSLSSNEESLQKYPYEFLLEVEYTLLNNSINVGYRVINTNEQKIHFSLGAHPAFFCPLSKEHQFEDYLITMEKNETSSILLLSENGLISDNRSAFFSNSNEIKLTDELFTNDALIFDDLQSKALTISSEKDPMQLLISWKNFPHLGIWKPLNAPFLCIEPWQGMADFENQTGDFTTKFGIITLEKGKEHSASYAVSINNQ